MELLAWLRAPAPAPTVGRPLHRLVSRDAAALAQGDAARVVGKERRGRWVEGEPGGRVQRAGCAGPPGGSGQDQKVAHVQKGIPGGAGGEPGREAGAAVSGCGQREHIPRRYVRQHRVPHSDHPRRLRILLHGATGGAAGAHGLPGHQLLGGGAHRRGRRRGPLSPGVHHRHPRGFPLRAALCRGPRHSQGPGVRITLWVDVCEIRERVLLVGADAAAAARALLARRRYPAEVPPHPSRSGRGGPITCPLRTLLRAAVLGDQD
mmetsp:Transcript_50164/g.160683  ORF Transcript_50164/g.160683 Transcript_50164/m.160683 type:complete len:263 (-) Transcript_50164:201-989(-)